MISIDAVRDYFRAALEAEQFVIDKTGSKMIELVGDSFLANEPAIFGTVNQEYVQHELDWYLSTSLNVNDIPGGPPKIWQQVADKDGLINSNYGWCIFHPDNGFQYDRTKEELIKNPWSRRAIMIYNRPTMHMDYNSNGMSDFMCTNAVQYMIRDNKLNAVVQMRSNDVVFGYKNDYAWQKFVLDKLAADLEVSPGKIIWNAGSLHVYERHFKLVV
jgi:thymidylate synthase